MATRGRAWPLVGLCLLQVSPAMALQSVTPGRWRLGPSALRSAWHSAARTLGTDWIGDFEDDFKVPTPAERRAARKAADAARAATRGDGSSAQRARIVRPAERGEGTTSDRLDLSGSAPADADADEPERRPGSPRREGDPVLVDVEEEEERLREFKELLADLPPELLVGLEKARLMRARLDDEAASAATAGAAAAAPDEPDELDDDDDDDLGEREGGLRLGPAEGATRLLALSAPDGLSAEDRALDDFLRAIPIESFEAARRQQADALARARRRRRSLAVGSAVLLVSAALVPALRALVCAGARALPGACVRWQPRLARLLHGAYMPLLAAAFALRAKLWLSETREAFPLLLVDYAVVRCAGHALEAVLVALGVVSAASHAADLLAQGGAPLLLGGPVAAFIPPLSRGVFLALAAMVALVRESLCLCALWWWRDLVRIVYGRPNRFGRIGAMTRAWHAAATAVSVVGLVGAVCRVLAFYPPYAAAVSGGSAAFATVLAPPPSLGAHEWFAPLARGLARVVPAAERAVLRDVAMLGALNLGFLTSAYVAFADEIAYDEGTNRRRTFQPSIHGAWSARTAGACLLATVGARPLRVNYKDTRQATRPLSRYWGSGVGHAEMLIPWTKRRHGDYFAPPAMRTSDDLALKQRIAEGSVDGVIPINWQLEATAAQAAPAGATPAATPPAAPDGGGATPRSALARARAWLASWLPDDEPPETPNPWVFEEETGMMTVLQLLEDNYADWDDVEQLDSGAPNASAAYNASELAARDRIARRFNSSAWLPERPDADLHYWKLRTKLWAKRQGLREEALTAEQRLRLAQVLVDAATTPWMKERAENDLWQRQEDAELAALDDEAYAERYLKPDAPGELERRAKVFLTPWPSDDDVPTRARPRVR